MKIEHRTEAVILPEFLSFRRMIAPFLLQFIFWPAVVASIYYNTWLVIAIGYHMEWWSLFSGIVMLRLAFECMFLYTYLRRID